jgi:hypothetical protein
MSMTNNDAADINDEGRVTVSVWVRVGVTVTVTVLTGCYALMANIEKGTDSNISILVRTHTQKSSPLENEKQKALQTENHFLFIVFF